MQTDYVDLFLIHEPYDESRLMYRAMKEAREAGKIKAVGISNFNGRRYSDFVKSCGLIPAVNQVVSFINGGSFSGSLAYAGAESVRQRKERFFRNAVLTKVGKKNTVKASGKRG